MSISHPEQAVNCGRLHEQKRLVHQKEQLLKAALEVCEEDKVNAFLKANSRRDRRSSEVQTPGQVLYLRLTTISLSFTPHTSDTSRSASVCQQASDQHFCNTAAHYCHMDSVWSQTQACWADSPDSSINILSHFHLICSKSLYRTFLINL